MTDYLIQSSHDVYEDTFEEGEGKCVNSYFMDGRVKAKNMEAAVNKYYELNLFYDYRKDNIADSEENDFSLYDSILVDSENMQASEYEIEEWKVGKKKLYRNDITIKVFELIQLTTDKFFDKVQK